MLHNSYSRSFEHQPSAVNDLRVHLIDDSGAEDVTGPLRIAQPDQQELILGDFRLLLTPEADYLPYEAIFSEAQLPMLVRDSHFSRQDVAVLNVPRDGRTISQVGNVHFSTSDILGRVFHMAGEMVGVLGKRTGQIPSPQGFVMSRLFILRTQGTITMLPPVTFFDDSSDNRDKFLKDVAVDLMNISGKEVGETYKQKINTGLNCGSSFRN